MSKFLDKELFCWVCIIVSAVITSWRGRYDKNTCHPGPGARVYGTVYCVLVPSCMILLLHTVWSYHTVVLWYYIYHTVFYSSCECELLIVDYFDWIASRMIPTPYTTRSVSLYYNVVRRTVYGYSSASATVVLLKSHSTYHTHSCVSVVSFLYCTWYLVPVLYRSRTNIQ